MDLAAKRTNFVSRLTNTSNANLDQINALTALYTEWMLSGYAGGQTPIAPASGTTPAVYSATAILDADLGQYPHLSAEVLNNAMGSLAAIKNFMDANGHTANLLALRP